MVLDYIILILYALSMIAIAFITKKRASSVNDFLLAGKKGLNGWMTAFSYGTTYFSAVIFIGYAGQFGKNFGLSSIWIGLGNAILGTLVAWIILAKRTRNMTRRLGAKTMPEFFEKRYGSQGIKLIAAVLIFIFLIPYSASVYNGLSTLFEIVLGIEGWIIMIALAALTALYLCFGGYFATALSDFIQGIIMIVGVISMIVCFMNHENIQWNISELINDPNLTWFTFSNENNSGLYGTTVSLISLILLTSIGVWGLPQTIHKYYAIRDKKAIQQGIIVSTLFALVIGIIAYFTGSLSYFFPKELSHLPANTYDKIIPTMLKVVIPSGFIGLIAVLILSASMSTLASVSLTSASVIAVDIYKGKINKGASDKRVNILMKLLCFAFVAISVILAILNDKFGIAAIAYMMGISWGTLAGCFIGPFVIGLLWKKVSRPAVWTSIIASPTITAILILVFGFDKGNWNCSFGDAIKNGVSTSPLIGVICMVFSIIATITITLLTKSPSKEIIYNAFDAPLENEIE